MEWSEIEQLSPEDQKKELRQIFKGIADVHKRLNSLIGRVAYSEGHNACDRFIAATKFAREHNIPLKSVITPKLHEQIKNSFELDL